MTFKCLPYKWTCLIGVGFLVSVLWSNTFRDGFPGFFLILLLFLCLLASTVVSIGIAATLRTKEAFSRVAINVVVFLLLFPTASLGVFLSNRLFLMRLPEFEEATNVLVENEKAKPEGERSSRVVPLPPRYSNLPVKGLVHIRPTGENITVRYFNRDSSALGHSGYMYRSDDNPTALEKEYPNTGYTRVAPHWFYFSE